MKTLYMHCCQKAITSIYDFWSYESLNISFALSQYFRWLRLFSWWGKSNNHFWGRELINGLISMMFLWSFWIFWSLPISFTVILRGTLRRTLDFKNITGLPQADFFFPLKRSITLYFASLSYNKKNMS